MEILDSGTRREFNTGAVRDIADNKGRCDLLPLDVVNSLTGDITFAYINDYIRRGETLSLLKAICKFIDTQYDCRVTAILDLAKHYEEGAKKYADRNWEKGIPLHCYIDSGVRHYLKFLRGDEDEPHGKAFLWNMCGAIWTHHHLPELIDLPFEEAAE